MVQEKRNFKDDFLNDFPRIQKFAGENFRSFDPVAETAKRKISRIDRTILVKVLNDQNQHLPGNEKMSDNIRLLEKENAFTITTGHQPCLLGGPLYTFYKILSAIRLAESLSHSTPDKHFIPVFWMATEDHDFEEINHWYSSWSEKKLYPGIFEGPVGRHKLEQSIKILAGTFSEFFTPGKKLADAFREFIHFLFSDYGLVILDGDNPELKKQFAPVLKSEIENGIANSIVSETNLQFSEAGYEPQAHPRELNIFYLGSGKRELIVPSGDMFSLKGSEKKWKLNEILKEIEVFPENFSPNVILRPLYQATLLPDIIFCGGWAELTYWSQLRNLFSRFKIHFPVLVPRMQATLVKAQHAEHWKSLGLSFDLLGNSNSEIAAIIASKYWKETELNERNSEIENAFDSLKIFLSAIDPTLAKGSEAEVTRIHNYLEQLPKKIRKAIANRLPAPFRDANSIRDEVQPEGKQQERILNFTAFADEKNIREFIPFLYSYCEPLNPEMKWIQLK